MLRILAILLSFLTGPALAQPITIRSGAHNDFARLVLDVPRGTRWTLEQNDERARITLSNHSDGFDARRVFARIDRTYVASVSSTAASLEITFSCDCKATAFAQGDRMVVVDISAKQTDPEERIDTRLDSFALRFVGRQPIDFTPAAPKSELKNPDFAAMPTVVEPVQAPIVQLAPPPAAELPTTTQRLDSRQLQQAHQKLSERLGLAATQGILSPSMREISLPNVGQSPQINTRIFDSSNSAVSEETSPVGGNLRITSSLDIPPQDGVQQGKSTTLGIQCIDPTDVAIHSWAPETGFAPQVSQLRAKLFTELDRLDQGTATDLAKTYLHFGFGAEARQLLLMDGDLASENPALLDLAEILEYGHVMSSGYLEHFVDCDTDLALWAILAIKDIDASRSINVSAALRALTALPMHLRSFIAPELSRRLLAYGDKDGASAALRSIERTAEPLSPNANLAKADIELLQGETGKAQDRLSKVVNSNSQQSAEALIKFVESHLDADAEIAEDVATLVQAYATELRDDPIGADLERTHVLALAKSGQFDAAFKALSGLRNRTSTTVDETLRSQILNLLAKNADDIEFLEHAFEEAGLTDDTVDIGTRIRVTERFLELGFAEQAEATLRASQSARGSRKLRHLQARIALALSRPEEALAYVNGIEGETADSLRANAMRLAGQYANAHAIYSQLDDQDNRQRVAWLADDWRTLVTDEATVFGPVARISQTSFEDDPQLEGMLLRADTAIAESKDARQAIQDMLNSESLGANGEN